MRKLHWCLLVLLAGCSPYQFSQEVGDFSTGVDQLSSSFSNGYTGLAADRAAAAHQALLDRRPRVTTTVSCGVPGKADDYTRLPCGALELNQPQPAPLNSQVDRKTVTDKLQVLQNYVHALQAVTNAADRAAFDAAAQRLEGAVSNLATTANAAAPGAGAIAPAATNVVLWVVGTALDNDRFDALRNGVTLAATPVKNISAELGTALQIIADDKAQVLTAAAKALLKPLGPKLAATTYKERLVAAEAILAELDAVQLSAPAQAAQKMSKAHSALVAAVQSPHPQLAELMKSLSDFEAAAKPLKDALTAPAK
jgi:hypothetical protein